MNLTKYGKDVLIKVLLLGIVLCLAAIFINNRYVRIFALAFTALFSIFTLYFFRDPDRSLPKEFKTNQIISPADGKVVMITEVINKEKNVFEENEKLRQISIFLSPLDVHVNRIPINGVVKFLKYIKGEYIVAFDHKSSDRNERTEIGIVNQVTNDKVLFKQIAGYVARRIVYEIKEGSEVTAGERFGMIKFGSRVDILIKQNSHILVKLDQRVVGGETIIAEL